MAWNGLMCLIIPNKHYLGFFFENNQFISVVLCIFFLKFSYGNIIVISNKILMVISNLPTVNDFSWRLLFICWWIIWKKSFLSIEFFLWSSLLVTIWIFKNFIRLLFIDLKRLSWLVVYLSHQYIYHLSWKKWNRLSIDAFNGAMFDYLYWAQILITKGGFDL